MAKNLNYGNLVSPANQDSDAIFDNVPEKSCADSACTYGGLYSWYEMMQTKNADLGQPDEVLISDRQGICPDGWHVPNLNEYQILFEELRNTYNNTSQSLLAKDTEQPAGINGGTNETGFSATHNGFLRIDGTSIEYGNKAYYWTASRRDSTRMAFSYFFLQEFSRTTLQSRGENFFLSCRCVKD